METKVEEKRNKIYKMSSFLVWVIASVIFRLILIYFPKNLNLSSRPEVSTPLTSIRRLAEGYWLKQSSMSPYAGSMYHGSPLLLSLLGPLTVKSTSSVFAILNFLLEVLCTKAVNTHTFILLELKGNPIIFYADVMSAMLLRATGQNLQAAYTQRLKSLELHELSETSEIISSGDIAALVYLWNPFTIVACVGLSTSPIENLAIILSLYGACTRLPPLAAFGWVMATHLSLYPAILIIPLIILLGYGPDAPPRKLFLQSRCSKGGDNPLSSTSCQQEELNQSKSPMTFSGKPVIHFLLWISVWSVYVLILCRLSVQQNGGLLEMFKSTYGFILTVEDLSPNMGVLWYFFAEVFEFFRDFFLIVFHVNILFMVLPLAIRLNHRPCFLAFVYIAISSMLKSYPSVSLQLFACFTPI
ncbi:hypothetical protein Pint_17291 [Pistacia integerrima]|uniref:Uncharacterized protein n=1 Tax=Pistacia integerrima TaxID=434235 RepID=A0ACC0YYL7_9ROSI|nr:hypothetical protein Pint_17291 [Pistacia integerrima]